MGLQAREGGRGLVAKLGGVSAVRDEGARQSCVRRGACGQPSCVVHVKAGGEGSSHVQCCHYNKHRNKQNQQKPKDKRERGEVLNTVLVCWVCARDQALTVYTLNMGRFCISTIS